MNTILLSPLDLSMAAGLVLVDAGLSAFLRLNLHRQLLFSASRMIVQLVAVGYLLRAVFSLQRPIVTIMIVTLMAAVACGEILARPRGRLGISGLYIAASGVTAATAVTLAIALFTAIKPQPWFDPRYAIPLSGIVLGSILNAGSLTLDTLLTDVFRERNAIEAQLSLGSPYRRAIAPLLRNAIRRGLVPVVNQMSAAGIVTLPGIMTGQILAGADPTEAVKYQIMIMFLLSGASGLSAVIIGELTVRRLSDSRQRLRLDRVH